MSSSLVTSWTGIQSSFPEILHMLILLSGTVFFLSTQFHPIRGRTLTLPGYWLFSPTSLNSGLIILFIPLNFVLTCIYSWLCWLGLPCHVWAFSSCAAWGRLFPEAAAPPAAELCLSAQVRAMGPSHPETSFRVRGWVCAPWTGRWTPNHWTTREALSRSL